MQVYILMGNVPVCAYRSKDRALYDAWLMTEGEKYDENPITYWVKEVTMDEEDYEVMMERTVV